MNTHKPVLMNEVIKGLEIIPNGIYFDCTFGRGGHSEAILARLSPIGRLIAIDKDLTAVKYAQEKFAEDPRFQIEHASFKDIKEIAKKHDVLGKVNGVFMDLGVSSPQLDNQERGFSFINDGPLDMRMDSTQSLNAEEFVNETAELELARVFQDFGEEKFAKRIARAIVNARNIKRITKTLELAEIVKAANPKWEKHKHPATRVFQAIRIYVNQELSDLVEVLEKSLDVLTTSGRLVVISFHSLEDRIVKKFMQYQEKGDEVPVEIPIKFKDIKQSFRRIGKAIKPVKAEVQQNIRARSAVLRIGEKLS